MGLCLASERGETLTDWTINRLRKIDLVKLGTEQRRIFRGCDELRTGLSGSPNERPGFAGST